MKPFKFLQRLFSIFGLVMVFAVSGWGANVNLTLTFSDSPDPVDAGGSLTYSIDVSNSNLNKADNVIVTIPLPAGTTYISGSSCILSGSNAVCDFGTINKNNSKQGSFIVTAPSTGGTISATATVTTSDNNQNPTKSQTTTTTVSAPSANLALTNTDSPDPVVTNGTLVYTLNVSNAGPQAATGLTLTDTLPAGVTYQSAIGAGWTCSRAAGVVTCTNPTLANGASSSIAVTVTAPSSAGSITNTATVTSTVTDPTPANNTNIAQTTTVNLPSADLSVTKSAPASVMVGNLIQYTINITNNGPFETALNMTDVLNANLTYINAYDDAHEWICSYTSADRTVLCRHPNPLANGATSTITLLATAPSTVMTISNSASVTGTLPDPNTANNTGSANVSVIASSFTNSNPRNFTLQKQYNINGDMKIIGNTIMQDANTHTCAAAGVNNNGITVEYVDIDTDASTFNSTSANITLPAGTTSNDVVWAGLYWQGYYGNGPTDATKTNAKNVLLKAPSGSYTTIQSNPAKFNWVYFDDAKTRWYYQGGQDVTSYVKSGLSGTYTVANVYSQTGGGIAGGGFGAWALVVLYRDNSATLKNLSVYDGYLGISSSDAGRTGVYANTSVPLSGFFTPTSGNINSKFMTFVGEGDVGLTGDFGSLSNSFGDIKLKNTLNPNDNLFNATVSDNGVAVTARNPQCTNNIGIDIDTFDVGSSATTPTTQGQIIENGQTSTNVKLSSSGDGYFPGLFAFSTDLYIPDVCYLESVKFNGLSIGGTNIPTSNDIVDYEVSITNKDYEPALGVYVEKIFDKPNEISYVAGSMNIAPIPGTIYPANNKTDARGDDTAEYYSDTNTSKLLLGTGATWYEGGTLLKDTLTKFKYKAKVGDQNASENTYLVSYHNDLLRVAFNGIPIRKCVDFNNSFGVYIPVIGNYNTVHTGAVAVASGEKDPLDPLDVKNALYTQLVNKAFSVDVIAFAADNITPTAPSAAVDLNLSIVELSSDGNCTNNNLSAVQTLHFTTSDKFKPATVTPIRASKNAAFHMVTSTANLCSRDNFAIRPAGFLIDANSTTLIGNRLYSFTFTAGQDSLPSIPSPNYNQLIHNSADKNATTQLILPAGCALPNPLEYTNVALPFSEGLVNALVLYSNVGNVNFTVTDNNWAAFDFQNSKGDCIVNSTSNVPDGNGKIGCMVKTSRMFSFLPEKFVNSLTVANGSVGNNYTYISNDRNMSASIFLSTTATLNGGGVATNYTKNCFAKNVTTTISLENNKILTWSDAQSRIKFYDDRNGTSIFQNQAGSTATFFSGEGNFTSGVAPITFKFNFDRNQTISDNPFNIARNDFNITSVVDQNGTTGSDFNRNADLNTTFLYGRTHASTQRYEGDTGPANIYYESFCFGANCNKTLLPNGIGSTRTDDVRWFVNGTHITPNDGSVGIVVQKGGGNVASDIVDATDSPAGNPSTTTLSYDRSKGFPYKTTMENGASSWLIYNESNPTATRNEFQVEFGSQGLWTGEHETNTTTKSVGGTTTNRRIMW